MRPIACRAVLFDLDGVLIDSTAVVEEIWVEFAERWDLDAAELLASVHGRRTEDTIREWAPKTDARVEAAMIERLEIDRTSGIRALPGASELLAALPSRSWAVVTAAGRELARARLRAAGLVSPPSDLLVGAEDVDAGKPDPEPYLEAAARLVLPPSACLVVEDAPAGVASANAAGMSAIALLTTHDANALDGAREHVRSLADLGVDASGWPSGLVIL
jgi:HAD superfamily hydrolase (TIGR01509 family)